MNYSDYPYRRCIHCESITECPEPKVLDDMRGTVTMPDDCPKKELIEKTIKTLKPRSKNGINS